MRLISFSSGMRFVCKITLVGLDDAIFAGLSFARFAPSSTTPSASSYKMRLVPSSKRTCFTLFAARSFTKALYSTVFGALALSAERRAAAARTPSAADAVTKTAKTMTKARDAKRPRKNVTVHDAARRKYSFALSRNRRPGPSGTRSLSFEGPRGFSPGFLEDALSESSEASASPALRAAGVTGSSLTCLSSCSTWPSAARAATRRAPPRPSRAPIATRGVGAGAPNARGDGRERASRRRSASRLSAGLDSADARTITRLSVARSRRAVASPRVATPAPPSARIDKALMCSNNPHARPSGAQEACPACGE